MSPMQQDKKKLQAIRHRSSMCLFLVPNQLIYHPKDNTGSVLREVLFDAGNLGPDVLAPDFDPPDDHVGRNVLCAAPQRVNQIRIDTYI